MRLGDNDSSFSGVSASGSNTFTGSNSFNGPVIYGRQTFASNGGTIGTVSAAGAPLVEVTGTSGGTLFLPASPTSGLKISVFTAGTITVNGNGWNIDGAGTMSVSTTGMEFVADGASWHVGPPNVAYLTGQYARLAAANTFTSTITFSGATAFNHRLQLGVQTFSGAGTVSNTGAPYVVYTGTAGATITLPATPTSNSCVIVKDEGGNAGTNNLIVSGGSINIEGSVTKTINTNYGVLRLRYNGTQWFTW